MPTSPDPAAPVAPEAPESSLPERAATSHTRHVPRLGRLMTVMTGVALAAALGIGAASGTLGGHSGVAGHGTPTVATAPASPGATTAPGGVTVSPPTTQKEGAPRPLPGSDLTVVNSVDSASRIGNTVMERLNITITNTGSDASAPGDLALTRDGDPATISGYSGTVATNGHGPDPSGFSIEGGKLKVPGIPPGGKATIQVNYSYTGATKNVTATFTAGGSVILGTSTPTVPEGNAL